VSADPLPSLDRSTLRERALRSLRAAITSGRYRPGDHLGEVELASHLGVSRGTVREALRHLQQEGLVTAGNRGMLRVNSVTPREIRELFRVRAALEGLAVTEIIALSLAEASVKVRSGPPSDDADDIAAGHRWAGVLPVHSVFGAPESCTTVPIGEPVPDHVTKREHPRLGRRSAE